MTKKTESYVMKTFLILWLSSEQLFAANPESPPSPSCSSASEPHQRRVIAWKNICIASQGWICYSPGAFRLSTEGNR